MSTRINVQKFGGHVEVASNLTVDTTTLHVDSVTNSIGVGTTLPAYKLDVNGTLNSGALTATTGTFSGAVSGTTGTFSGAVTVTDTTQSTTKDTGALIVTTGGLGVEANIHSTNVFAASHIGVGTSDTTKALDVRGTANVGALTATTGTFSGAVSATTGTFSGAVSATTGSFSEPLSVTKPTHSTNKDTGALIVTTGGLGVEANIHSTNVFAASHIGVGTSDTTKALDVRGTANVGTLTATTGTFSDTTHSTNKDTGALIVTGGGLGVEANIHSTNVFAASHIAVGTSDTTKALDVRGTANVGTLTATTGTFSESLTVTKTTQSTNKDTGALIVTTGGLGVEANIHSTNVFAASHIGVGTSDTTKALDVRGTANVGALSATTGTFSGALSATTGTFSGTVTAPTIEVPDDGDFVMNSKPLVPATGMYWDRVNSRLGLGTSSPTYTLDVHGHANVGVLTVTSFLYAEPVDSTSTTTGAIQAVGIGVTSNLHATNVYASTLYTSDYVTHTSDINTKIGFPADDTFTVTTAGTERLRVDSSGRVGVGTTSPQDTLHVYGAPMIQHDTRIASLSTAAWYKIGTWDAAASDGARLKISLLGGSGYGVSTRARGGETIIYASINNNNPTTSANIDGLVETHGAPVTTSVKFKQDSTDRTKYEIHAYIATYTQHSMSVECSGTTTFTKEWTASTDPGAESATVSHAIFSTVIDNSGNVGIGTTAPGYKLDVNGTLNSGALTATNGTFSGALTVSGTATTAITKVNSSAATNTYNYLLNGPRPGTSSGGAVHFINGSARTTDGGASTYTIRNDSGKLRLGSSSYDTDVAGTLTVPSDGDFVMAGKSLNPAAGLHWDRTNLRLGVGTTTPAYKLDVHGTSNVGALTATSVSGNGSGLTNLNAGALTSGTVPSARLSLAASDIPSLDADKITTGTLGRPISTTTGSFSTSVTTPYINGHGYVAERFYAFCPTNNTSKYFLGWTSEDNMEIDIRDTGWNHGQHIKVYVRRAWGTQPKLIVYGPSSTRYNFYYTEKNDRYYLWFNETYPTGPNGNENANYYIKMRSTSSAINTTEPGAADAYGGVVIGVNSATLIPSSSYIFRADYDGNVGIGTNDPGYKLDVNGAGRFSGALTATTGTFSTGVGVRGTISTGRNLAREVGSVISYSSQYTADRGAANVINGSKNFENGSNDWITASGQRANAYVVIDLGAAYAVDRLVIYNQNEYNSSVREVKGFKLQGSTDNSTWVDVIVSECGRSNGQEPNPGWSFRIPQNWDDDDEGTSYRYWKFIMTSFHGTDSYGGITELELYEARDALDDEVSTSSLVAEDVYSETGNFSRGVTIGKGYGGTSTGANNLIVEGNVGIGVTNPGVKLDISATSSYNPAIRIGTNTTYDDGQLYSIAWGGSALMGMGPYSATRTVFGSQGLGLHIPNTEEFSVRSNSWAKLFALDGATNKAYFGGNVGIGTTSPSYNLHVAGTSQFEGEMRWSLGTIMSHAGYSTNKDWYIRSGETAGNVILQDTGGNVGIGTSSPGCKLHVAGAIRLDAQTVVDPVGTSSISDLGNRTQTYIVFGEAGTSNDWAFLRQIGGSNGYHLALDFHDDGVDAGFSIRDVQSTANPDAVTTRFIVERGGNVGIGTDSPGYPLDVNGTLRHAGLVITSGYNVDQAIVISKSLTVSTSWIDTGISGTDLATGLYVVRIYNMNTHTVGGKFYEESASALMEWFSGITNSTDVYTLLMHASGHASNGSFISLRTARTPYPGRLKLQIQSNASQGSAYTYQFWFRRLL